jgi:hypothetical protein
MHRTIIWRRVLAFDLGLFNIAIFFFGLLPSRTLEINETIAMIFATIAFIGVIARAINRITLPGEEWSYLATGALGAYVFFGYVLSSPDPYDDKVPFALFLLSGIASAYAAHVIDGGKEK